MTFTPCRGKSACRDDGQRCLTCGRSLVEIVQLRQLMDQLTELAITNGYDNVDEFAAYIARKVPQLVALRTGVTQEN